jgi:Fic family protein
LRWAPNSSGQTRADQRGCDYDAYLPDMLSGQRLTLDGEVASEVARAEAAIASLDRSAVALTNLDALARILLRAEAVASSRIEGLSVGARKLLRADAAREQGDPSHDPTVSEVLNNIDAATYALETSGPITPDLLLEVHSRLLGGTLQAKHAGHWRTEQNWLGGSDHNPCAAEFVPPPWERVEGLMDDLCQFVADAQLPTVALAALAHAQFETIHPFADGNGRTGRVLVSTILQRSGLAGRVIPPVSLVLATLPREYVGGLTTYRHAAEPGSQEAHDALNKWVGWFARVCVRAVDDAQAFEQTVSKIQAKWRETAAPVRRNSATDLLLDRLPGTPIIGGRAAAKLLGRSFPAANQAIQNLVSAGVLRQVSIGRRNRAYEAPAIIDAFTDLERRLASPAADTQVAAPVRPVPPRRRDGARQSVRGAR